VRRNRRRFWKSESDTDKVAAYQTLYEALVTVTKLAAPFIPFVTDAMYRNLVLAVQPDAPMSVHLADFPEADVSLIDEKLLKETGSVIKVVSVGRAARSAAKLKVRQPLPEVLVKPRNPDEREGLERFSQQVLEELNVKGLTVVTPEQSSEIMSYSVKANFKLLGPKLGKKLPEVQKALAGVNGSQVAAQVRAGQNVEVKLADGETVSLAPDEVLVEAKQKEGFTVVEDGGYVVALNTTVTPELKREGLLRDLVRFVQDTRKNAGFNVSDKITTYYLFESDKDGTAASLEEALNDPAGARYVMAETLSTELHKGDAPNGIAFSQMVDLDGANLKLSLVKNG
jgi:isoleucyl-tRNA synthetase